MTEKLCVFCKHWSFSGGEPGYSEMTPGSDASMYCDKNMWGRKFRLWDISGAEDFRKIIKTAETCQHYELPPVLERKDAPGE